MQDAKIHYGLTLSDSSAELLIDERKAISHQSKAVIKPESSQAIAIQPSLPPTTSKLMLNHHLQWSMGSVFVKLPSLLENDNLENLLNKLFLHLALSHNITL